MQRRVLLLPVIWGAFGIGEVLALSYFFGPIINNIPYATNDKPIGGSYLPALFFNAATLLGVFALSLYALGIWNIDLSNRKTRIDLIALGVLLTSGILIFTTAIALFPIIVVLLYFMATNIE